MTPLYCLFRPPQQLVQHSCATVNIGILGKMIYYFVWTLNTHNRSDVYALLCNIIWNSRAFQLKLNSDSKWCKCWGVITFIRLYNFSRIIMGCLWTSATTWVTWSSRCISRMFHRRDSHPVSRADCPAMRRLFWAHWQCCRGISPQ